MKIQFSRRQVAAWAAALSISASVAQAALIHRYSFNDGTAKDSVGKIDGTLKGPGASIADGKLVLKNKESDAPEKLSYLEFAAPVLPKSGSVTLICWFTGKEVGSFSRIINFGDREGDQGLAFLYVTPRTGDDLARAAISATDTGGKTFVDPDRLDDGKPHMLAIVIDGKARKLHFFVDGKEPQPAEDLGENTLDTVKPKDNWLGRSSFSVDPGLEGSIDEFRVYDHALTADEVKAAFAAGPDALPAASQPATQPSK